MKISALGVLLLTGGTFLAACDGNRNYPPPSSATPVASASGKVPTQADTEACNEYAHDQTKTGTGEVVKDAAIGGVGGAAVGAGAGAIAGGGSGVLGELQVAVAAVAQEVVDDQHTRGPSIDTDCRPEAFVIRSSAKRWRFELTSSA